MCALVIRLSVLASVILLSGQGDEPDQSNPELTRVYLSSARLMPAAIDRVLPGYPESTSEKPFSGDIDVETVVSTTGEVIHAFATLPGAGRERFRAAALDAARRWRFRPAVLENGTPLPVLVLLRMTFRGASGRARSETSARVMAAPTVPVRAPVPAVTFSSVPDGSRLTLVRSVQPQYTNEARQRSIEGAVSLRILVLPDGSVGEVSVDKSLDRQTGLDEQAMIAARYWLFEPAVVDGQPVAVRTRLELEFRLR